MTKRKNDLPRSAAWRWLAGTAACGAALAVAMATLPAAEGAAETADGYIGGVVTSSAGPEAGVWVIAETDELDTKLAKNRRDR